MAPLVCARVRVCVWKETAANMRFVPKQKTKKHTMCVRFKFPGVTRYGYLLATLYLTRSRNKGNRKAPRGFRLRGALSVCSALHQSACACTPAAVGRGIVCQVEHAQVNAGQTQYCARISRRVPPAQTHSCGPRARVSPEIQLRSQRFPFIPAFAHSAGNKTNLASFSFSFAFFSFSFSLSFFFSLFLPPERWAESAGVAERWSRSTPTGMRIVSDLRAAPFSPRLLSAIQSEYNCRGTQSESGCRRSAATSGHFL